MPDPNTIGGVNFEITATGAPQAQAAIKETARVAEETAQKTAGGGLGGPGGAGGINETGAALGGANVSAARLLGNLGLIAATGALFFRLGQSIREGLIQILENGKEKADKFKLALDVSDSKNALTTLDGKLKEINSKIAANTESWLGWARNVASGETTARLIEQRDELEKTAGPLRLLEALQKRYKDRIKETADERKAEADEARVLFNLLLAQNQQRFDDETEKKARKAREEADAEEKRRQEKDAYDLAEYEASLRDQARREQEAKDKASLQRRAAEARASFRATLADAANAAVGNEIVYSLSKIGGALESIRSQTASRDLSNSGGFE